MEENSDLKRERIVRGNRPLWLHVGFSILLTHRCFLPEQIVKMFLWSCGDRSRVRSTESDTKITQSVALIHVILHIKPINQLQVTGSPPSCRWRPRSLQKLLWYTDAMSALDLIWLENSAILGFFSKSGHDCPHGRASQPLLLHWLRLHLWGRSQFRFSACQCVTHKSTRYFPFVLSSMKILMSNLIVQSCLENVSWLQLMSHYDEE